MNYTVWPLVQYINFRFLPLKYRVPFVSAVGVLWVAYLSLLNSEAPEVFE
jgi:protein Mpv17